MNKSILMYVFIPSYNNGNILFGTVFENVFPMVNTTTVVISAPHSCTTTIKTFAIVY